MKHERVFTKMDTDGRYCFIIVIPKNLVCHHLSMGWGTKEEGVYALAEVVKEGYPDCTSPLPLRRVM
jgi:hypothetical protein